MVKGRVMESLSSEKCESCRGLPLLSAEEIAELLQDSELEGWTFGNDGIAKINKTFKFELSDDSNWDEAWGKSADFVKKMLDLMREEKHHASYTHVPARKGGSVNVILVTHEVKGLSKNDFRMAAKLNKLHKECK